MTSTRDDAAGVGAVGPGERSVVGSLRGLRWWGVLVLAAVLTGAGMAIDMLTSGELGVVFTACFAGGCILATAWARRDTLFVPLVQPPLLLAVGVPAVVVATGSLPRSGGLASTLLAVGGPLVNAFPTLAITTAICLALGFVRSRVEPWQRPGDDLDPDAGPDPRDRPPRERPARDQRDRPPKDRDPRDRPPKDRDRPPQERDPRDRPPKDRDPRDRPPKDRDPRDRPPKDRDRPPQERDPRDRPPKDREPRDRPPKERDPRDREPQERDPRDRERTRRVPVETRPARDDRRRPARPDDPDDEFGPGVRRVPRRVDGPDGPR